MHTRVPRSLGRQCVAECQAAALSVRQGPRLCVGCPSASQVDTPSWGTDVATLPAQAYGQSLVQGSPPRLPPQGSSYLLSLTGK